MCLLLFIPLSYNPFSTSLQSLPPPLHSYPVPPPTSPPDFAGGIGTSGNRNKRDQAGVGVEGGSMRRGLLFSEGKREEECFDFLAAEII